MLTSVRLSDSVVSGLATEINKIPSLKIKEIALAGISLLLAGSGNIRESIDLTGRLVLEVDLPKEYKEGTLRVVNSLRSLYEPTSVDVMAASAKIKLFAPLLLEVNDDTQRESMVTGACLTLAAIGDLESSTMLLNEVVKVKGPFKNKEIADNFVLNATRFWFIGAIK